MNPSISRKSESDLEQRCDIRLENDATALKAVASPRMEVSIMRFGSRVTEIHLRFPSVMTSFKNLKTLQIEVASAEVIATLLPHVGSGHPYPLSAPKVRLIFPNLTEGKIPFLSGLAWLDESDPNVRNLLDDMPEGIPAGMFKFLEAFINGEPCLWRDGMWNRERDLVFIAGQIHRLLTNPGAWSRLDAKNLAAAHYWSVHKDQMPFESPIPEISGRQDVISVGRRHNCCASGLTLQEIV